MSTKFLSPGWRMPRNANQSKSTNYSLDFIPTDIINVSGFSTALSNVNNGTRSSDNNLPFSWSVWFKSRNSSNSQGEIAGYGQSQRNGIRIHNNVFRSNYTSDLAGTTTISQNIWYHGVVTYDGTTRKIYINGVFDNASDTPASAAISNQPLTIGVYPGGTSSFNGELNELCFFDYALSQSQVTTLYGNSTNGVGSPMALPSSPIAYYPLGTSAYNGEYLAENNAIGDYVFDFSSDVINTNSLGISGANSRTISCWFNADSNSTQNIIGFGATGSNGSYFTIAIYNSNIFAHTWNTGGVGGDLSGSAVNSGKWHLAVMTYDGTNLKISLDGGTYATTTASLNTTNSIFKIGSSYYTAWNNFSGKISNTKVWNTDLSQAEVTTLYNNGSPIQTLANIPQNSNLQGWYKLDASEVYNSTTTEWSIDNNQNPSAYASSLNFDGTNDYISLPTITLTDNWSVSVWMNQTALKLRSQAVGTTLATPTNNFWYYSAQVPNGGADAGKLIYYNYSTSQYTPLSNNRLDDGNWHNWIITYNHSTTTLKCYIDGQENYSDTYNAGTGNTINRISNSFASNYWLGQLSNVSVWNTALTSAQVTEIYNNGTPSNLSSHSTTSNLVSWWKLNNTTTGIEDSKGSNNGTNNGATEYAGFVNTLAGESSGMSQANLVQSDLQTVAPYSKYAMNFDGINDYINIPSFMSNLPSNNIYTISTWVKTDSDTNCLWGSSSIPNLLYAFVTNGTTFGVQRGSAGNINIPNLLTVGEWANVVAVFDSTTNCKLYINNVFIQDVTVGSLGTVTDDFKISGGLNGYHLACSQSNFSVWNSALTSSQVSEIYNEGLPGNLNSHSAYSNLVSWWQLGENSSFDGNDWICADEKGTNNGTSAGMPVGALTNGVGTTANGVSTGMSEGSLVGDAPYSTANALSTNMVVTSRVTGSGNTP